MGVFNENAIIGASAAGVSYKIDYSCRFDAARQTSLTDTPGSNGSKRKFTVSAWVKFGGTYITGGSGNAYRSILLRGYDNDDNNTAINAWTTLDYFSRVGNSATNVGNIRTEALVRDASSWYHFVVAIDTEQGASVDRCKLYINGVLHTDFSANDVIAEDQDIPWWAITSVSRKIGHYLEGAGGTATQSWDNAYVAEYYYIDGAQVAASVFGETNEDTNQWVPIDNSDVQDAVTFGTLGFYLDFADSTDLGKDVSGQGNHFASSGFAVRDQMIDTPTNNFATINQLIKSYSGPNNISEGNLKIDQADDYNQWATTFALKSGKWYCEFRCGDAGTAGFGIIADNATKWWDSQLSPQNGSGHILYTKDGVKNIDGTETSYGNSFTDGDIIGMAVNLTDSEVTYYKNGTVQNSGTAISFSGGITSANLIIPGAMTKNGTSYFNGGSDSSFSGTETAQGNTDGNAQGDFYYTPPSGYLALCTDNLPGPAIKLPSDNQTTVIYTGNDSNQTITTGFPPGLIWWAYRDSAGQRHKVVDEVRQSGVSAGTTKLLDSTNGDAEMTSTSNINELTSTGYTLLNGDANDAPYNFVSWNWKADGVGSANTDGTINSTVSVNSLAGFSIVKWVGNGLGSQTIGHGLSQAPELIINKNYSDSGSVNWVVWSSAVFPTTGNTKRLVLNTNAGQVADTCIEAVTASTWEPENGTGSVNGDGSKYINYCFYSVEGYSQIGKYTGNANVDGTFVYTGFRPSWVMMKQSDGTNSWHIYDNKRSPYNKTQKYIYADSENAEGTGEALDFVSNGFKFRNAGSGNNNANPFLYLAFAESPFKTANAR